MRPTVRYILIILALSTLGVALARPISAQDPAPTNWRFGIIEAYDSPSHADRLAVGWTRISFHWAEVQGESAQEWHPPLEDDQIAAEIAAGRMLIGLLIGIPDWARDEAGLPEGLWLPPDDPENTWATFVRQTVTRYRGRIDHWVIWNEPDIPKTELAHSWNGTVADFAQLQRTAYIAAKAANPEASIHLPAVTYWADYYAGTEQYLARLLDEILADPQAPAHNYYFDVATAHLYFQPGQIYDLLNLFTNIMRERGLRQPIWLVETNAPPKDDPSWPVGNWTLSVTSQEQAAFMPQALVAGLASGAERIGVYKLKDTEDDRNANPEPFGLVRMDGSERPAFATYRIAVGYLDDIYQVERERWDHVAQFRVDQPGQTTRVLFARLPEWQQAEVPGTAETAVLVDMWGTKKVITPIEGIYEIDLAPASCSQSIGDYCMIGGPVSYLIQAADVQPPTETPTSTPTALPTSTPSPSPTSSPTQAPTATASPMQAAAITSVTPESQPIAQTNANLAETPALARDPAQQIESVGRFPLGTLAVGFGFLLLIGLVFLLRRRGG